MSFGKRHIEAALVARLGQREPRACGVARFGGRTCRGAPVRYPSKEDAPWPVLDSTMKEADKGPFPEPWSQRCAGGTDDRLWG